MAKVEFTHDIPEKAGFYWYINMDPVRHQYKDPVVELVSVYRTKGEHGEASSLRGFTYLYVECAEGRFPVSWCHQDLWALATVTKKPPLPVHMRKKGYGILFHGIRGAPNV